MPEINVDDAMEATRQLVRIEKDWIPSEPGTSLYIRPNMIASEAALGVHVSSKYMFYIIVGPVGAYYPQGFNPTDIYVSEKYTRAAVGGLGEAKTSGNYAASLLAQKEAHDLGYTQVLWLDAVERKYIEEVGHKWYTVRRLRLRPRSGRRRRSEPQADGLLSGRRWFAFRWFEKGDRRGGDQRRNALAS